MHAEKIEGEKRKSCRKKNPAEIDLGHKKKQESIG